MTAPSFEGDNLLRLKAAAEDIAFLAGRGYPDDPIRELVTNHRKLTKFELALLSKAVCSESQYKARALKEMLPEDIAKRPLLVDGEDLFDAVTTALAGQPVLFGIDQTVQPISPGGVSEKIPEALKHIGAALKEMRPSKTTWVFSTGRSEVAAMESELLLASKKWKVPVEIEKLDDPKARLKKGKNVASNDPAVIDLCPTYCNLAGAVVMLLPGVVRVSLQ